MTLDGNKPGNKSRWRAKAERVYLSGSSTPETSTTGTEAALSFSGVEVNTPEDGVSHEEVVPVVSNVYDAPSLRERLARRSRLTGDYIRHMSLEQWLWIGVLLLATVLRFWDLGAKPLHHDESMHAFFSLTFARNPASYQYDPLLHGPFQFHAEGFVFMVLMAAQRLFGVGGAAGSPWINDTTARILPALFGVGIVALPIGLRRQLGRYGAIIAGLLLAVSPAFVYFSRFLREDIYFNFFMFAMVVCAVHYARKRTIRWMVGLFLSSVFAYATFEGIYLTLVIFLSFLAILVLWEIAYTLARKLPAELNQSERLFFSRAGLMLAAGGVGGILAYIGLQVLHNLNTYVTAHTTQADVQVAQLESATVLVLLYLSIIVAIVVIGVLLWQISRDDAQVSFAGEEPFLDADDEFPPQTSLASRLQRFVTAPGRRMAAMRERIDPKEKPFLHLLLGISWVHWFVGCVAGWMLFAALYWVLPPGPNGGLTWGQGFQVGVGRGVWQGLYYWLQQQQVARGGQPPYYYLLLLPLYEQLAIVFGLAGAVYSLFRPTRFRLFLIWWFVISMALYSWAGEKMPWLSIHILLPLMLLAAVMLERLLEALIDLSWNVREYGLRALALRPAGEVALASTGSRLSRSSSFSRFEASPDDPDGSDDPGKEQDVRDGHVAGVSEAPHDGTDRVSLAHEVWEPPAFLRPFQRVYQPAVRAARYVYPWVKLIARYIYRYIYLPVARVFRRVYHAVAWRAVGAIVSAALALALFIPMVHSMVELAYVDPADGPHEMMVYVQTTPDVTTAMAKIAAADQKLYGGRHQLNIWVGQGEEWPMYWYLRDYFLDPHPSTYVKFDPNVSDPFAKGVPVPDVLILLPSDAGVFMAAHPGYHAHQYKLRSWWDESYKPLPYVPSKTVSCPSSQSWGTGVGLPNYLSYGSNPPPGAKFDLGRTVNRLWNWLWYRQPLGDVNGSYDFTLVVRDGLPIQP